jgi:prepilin-type N-terminal cleavage/methylation domain-containing protein
LDFKGSKNTPSHQLGLTLIEMLIVVGIISIMSGIGVTFLNFKGLQLKSAAYELKTALMSARAEAIKRNADVQVQFDAVNDTYNATNDLGTVLFARTLDQRVDLSTNNTSVTFKPLGTATNSNFQIIATNGASYTVQVNSVGKISLELN